MFDSKIWKFITNFFGFSSDNKSEQKPKVIKKKIIVFHKVNAGETLYSIAKSNGVSVEALKEANGLKGDGISAGQRLRIPSKASKTIFPVDKKSDNSGFQMYREISDEQIINANEGNKYVKIVKYPDYTIKKGETAGSVAQKFAVSSKALLSLNNLNEKSIQIGQKVKIPSKRIARNIKNINDVSKATGLSVEYLQSLEKMEEKHNKIYKDKNGVNTIGIVHVVRIKN